MKGIIIRVCQKQSIKELGAQSLFFPKVGKKYLGKNIIHVVS